MKNKFIGVGILCSIVMVFYLVILVKLQIIEQSQYKKQVDETVSRKNVLQAMRGRIFDRNVDQPLAYNVSRYRIVINPMIFERDPENITHTAEILDISENIIINTLSQKSQGTDVVLRDNLDYQNILVYIEKIHGIKGLAWKRIIQREYIGDNVMSHVLGYVGDISVSELQTFSYRGYYNFDIIGKVGVEKQYEELLRGKTGISKEVVNVFGQKVVDSERIEEEIQPGSDIVLTLNRDIQILVEKAIGERVGAAVVMKPHTGEILAMASYPNFNPNLLVNSLNEKAFSEIQQDNQYPFLNRAIQSVAPPASTFKVLMLLSYLGEDPNNTQGHWSHVVYDEGYIKIGNRIFRCWYRSGHGYENYIKALEDSCNVFFYSIGAEVLGVSVISKYAMNFGLGQLTGIDLPGEVSGIVPTPDWKRQRFDQPWILGDTANLSIGQGYVTVSPLQLAVMMSGILNDGEIVKPRILKEVRDTVSGTTNHVGKREVIRKVDLDEKVYKAIRHAMRSVAIRGTSSVIMNNPAVKIAGKTGSGQIITDDFSSLHSWYLAFGPYDAPLEEQVVVVVWIDAVNDWEWWAPKAADIIFQGIFTDQNYEGAVTALRKSGSWWL